MEWRMSIREKERRNNRAFLAFQTLFAGCESTLIHVDYIGDDFVGHMVKWKETLDFVCSDVSGERVHILYIMSSVSITSSCTLCSPYSRRLEQVLVVCLTEPESKERGCAQASGPQHRENGDET